MALFEKLIGGPVTKAGNHRCRLPDRGGVSGGHGCMPSGPRRSCVGLQDSRCRAWLVHARIVVSLVAGVCPEEARAIWQGGRRGRCSTKEGVKAAARTHAEMRASRSACFSTFA